MWRVIYIVSLFFLLQFLKPFSYSVDDSKLVGYMLTVAAVSVFISALVGARLARARNFKAIFSESAKWLAPIAFFVVGSGMLISNNVLSTVDFECHKATGKEIHGSYRMGRSHLAKFDLGYGNTVLVGIRAELWKEIDIGDVFELEIVHGGWVDYVSTAHLRSCDLGSG